MGQRRVKNRARVRQEIRDLQQERPEGMRGTVIGPIIDWKYKCGRDTLKSHLLRLVSVSAEMTNNNRRTFLTTLINCSQC